MREDILTELENEYAAMRAENERIETARAAEIREKYPDIRYLVFCDNVYSGINFDRCFCKAGYMLRDLEDSGQVYEPKTVKTAFVINSNSRYAFLFGIDIEAGELIWLNTAVDSNQNVAGEARMSFMLDYFHLTDIINVKSFYEMAATEVVSDMNDAEVIVTDKEVKMPGKEIIREYDFEKMLGIMG